MDIKQALKLKVGDTVQYPADSPYQAGAGVIDYLTYDVNSSFFGHEYLWVSVKQVAPFAGAWIETGSFGVVLQSLKSHPSRVRGLKHAGLRYNWPNHNVAPFAGAWIETRT